jgi:hypothetical protein
MCTRQRQMARNRNKREIGKNKAAIKSTNVIVRGHLSSLQHQPSHLFIVLGHNLSVKQRLPLAVRFVQPAHVHAHVQAGDTPPMQRPHDQRPSVT